MSLTDQRYDLRYRDSVSVVTPKVKQRASDEAWIGFSWETETVDPSTPTAAAPGSMEKVMMLKARYAAGVPLWDSRDSYDHDETPQAGNAAATGVEQRETWRNIGDER